ncbi:FAD-dependent monooxygenase [Pelagibacteraceae bacterium]|nr:FAD-dependent monooxygenase [Pelagibacteraceae bacterium]
MKKQKICIIGDGLTGLTTSLALKNSAVEIDLYYESFGEDKIDKRITAISESNYMFLKHIEKKLKSHLFWTCKKIHLYYERKSELLNFLNFDKEEKSLMHIFENIKIKKEFRKLLKCKNIKLIKKKIKQINYENGYILFEKKKIYYDLIILCLGSKSKLYDGLTNNRAIKKDYKEIAITGYIKHNSKLINPRQYFLNEGPLAFLPFKKNVFSFVWSLNKNFYENNLSKLKTLINEKLKSLFGKSCYFKISEISSYPIHLNLQKNYYKKNVLILGEGLHTVHPVAGQGFNLVLRDIKKLTELIKNNLMLGMTLKNSNILKEFYETRKSENVMFGIGIDFANIFFKKNDLLDPIKHVILKNISKSKNVKKYSKVFSDKGISL